MMASSFGEFVTDMLWVLRVTALVVALLTASAVPVPARTIYVPGDEPTIQLAIRAANNGDLILVSPGTYFENIFYNGKAISIRSIAGSTRTIIDGKHMTSVVTFDTDEDTQSVLSGLCIQQYN